MGNLTDMLLNMIKLTDEVKALRGSTEKLTGRIIDIDKRVVRIETMIELTQKHQLSKHD